MTKWKIDWGAVAVLALLGVLMMGPLLAPQDPELVDLAKRLQRHVLARLPDALCPASFNCVADLPRTATGKIQRFQLRNRR